MQTKFLCLICTRCSIYLEVSACAHTDLLVMNELFLFKSKFLLLYCLSLYNYCSD
jgi:hypothetical protein